jgi:hypothetical protein
LRTRASASCTEIFVEPRPELRLAPELGEMREGPHVGLLHHVLRLGGIVQDGAGGAKQALVVPAHDALEQRRLAGEDTLDERGVGVRWLDWRRGTQHETLPSEQSREGGPR